MPNEFPKMKPGQFCIQYREIEHWPGLPKDYNPITYSSQIFDSIEEALEFEKNKGPSSPMAPEQSIRNHLNQDIRDVEKNE